MNEISQEIFEKYQVRKTRKQKSSFISFIQEKYKEAKVEKGGLLGSRNIVIGDVEKAEAIYTAHYDTCSRLPFPNFLTPKNVLIYALYNVLISSVLLLFYGLFLFSILAVAFILLFGFYYVSLLFGLFSLSSSSVIPFSTLYYGLIPILSSISFPLFFLLVFAGPANKHTANDNTSGVITLCEIYESLSEEEKEKVAFVFFDHEELGLWGSRFFRKKYKKEMKEKLLINFDCVSDGDTIMFVLNKKTKEKYGEKLERVFGEKEEGKEYIFEDSFSTIYPSDQKGFRYGVGVASFKKKKIIGFYMDKIHTGKDKEWYERNIEGLRKKAKKFLE